MSSTPLLNGPALLAEALRAMTAASIDAERLPRVIAERCARTLADCVFFYAVSESGTQLTACAAFDLDPSRAHRDSALFIDQSFRKDRSDALASVVVTGSPLLANTPNAIDALDLAPRELFRAHGLESLLAIPLRASGPAFGLLVFGRRSSTGAAFGHDDVTTGEALATHAALALVHSRVLVRSAREPGERARLQIALHAADEARDASDAVLATMRHPLVVLNSDLRVLSMNRAFSAVFGLAAGDVIGKQLYDVGTGEWNHPKLRQLLSELIPTHGRLDDFELEDTFAGLGRRILLLNAHEMLEPAYRDTTILLMIEDVTERRRAERLITQTSEQLHELNQELEDFTYSVSHDLRAPLRAIDGFCKILMEDHGPTLDSEGQRVIGVIGKNANKMGRLIDDLLAFSRVGRQPVLKRRVDMTALTQHVAEGACALEPERQIELEIRALPAAECDPSLIQQVLFNLLSNAVKYTRPRKPARIHVTGKSEPRENIYIVRDNGVGFETRYSHKLFRVFQRLHLASEFEGTGVGLALVERVIKRHGGRVWAEGELGRGATFGFSLPNDENPGVSKFNGTPA